MKKIVLLGLSLLFSLGVVAQETKAKTTKKAATEKAEKAKKNKERYFTTMVSKLFV